MNGSQNLCINLKRFFCFSDRSYVNARETSSNVRYGLHSGNIVMTISGREQTPVDERSFNDPHILPVHLYRAPPPSYSEVAAAKQELPNSSPHESFQGQTNTAIVANDEAQMQAGTFPESPPSYENIQNPSN